MHDTDPGIVRHDASLQRKHRLIRGTQPAHFILAQIAHWTGENSLTTSRIRDIVDEANKLRIRIQLWIWFMMLILWHAIAIATFGGHYQNDKERA